MSIIKVYAIIDDLMVRWESIVSMNPYGLDGTMSSSQLDTRLRGYDMIVWFVLSSSGTSSTSSIEGFHPRIHQNVSGLMDLLRKNPFQFSVWKGVLATYPVSIAGFKSIGYFRVNINSRWLLQQHFHRSPQVLKFLSWFSSAWPLQPLAGAASAHLYHS